MSTNGEKFHGVPCDGPKLIWMYLRPTTAALERQQALAYIIGTERCCLKFCIPFSMLLGQEGGSCALMQEKRRLTCSGSVRAEICPDPAERSCRLWAAMRAASQWIPGPPVTPHFPWPNRPSATAPCGERGSTRADGNGGEQAGAALRSAAEKRNARAKPSGGTHRLAVVQGPLVLEGALGAAAPPLPFAAARRGPAAREDGGGGAGALPAPAQCRAHARASAARNRRRRGGPAGAGSAFPAAAAPGRVRVPRRSRQCAESWSLRESPESALQHRPGYRG